MAGNKNPWRDIFSPAEWGLISANARAAAARGGPGGHRRAPQPQRWGATPTPLQNPADVLQSITNEITQYDAIAKDDSTLFVQRALKLRSIATLCDWYLRSLGATHVLGAKQPGARKALNDQIDVWVRSLGKRARKKSEYLEKMAGWHVSAKGKYKDRALLSAFLRGLADDNTRLGGQMLHATPYATIEKIDPYHRQTFVFLDPDETTAQDEAVNEMGTAFVEYLAWYPASANDTNPNPSFYEWLEYHPFSIGTPGIHGDARYQSPNRISYDGHDLGLVYLPPSRMDYTRIVTDAGTRFLLNTTDFRQSGKGPPGAAAFVWDGDGNLWVHEHGWDGFIHASAKQGKKIRCSGMLVVANGKATCITNQSGHYAPNAQSIYNFVNWLRQRDVLAPNATVVMEHDGRIKDGTYTSTKFMSWAGQNLQAPSPVPYLV